MPHESASKMGRPAKAKEPKGAHIESMHIRPAENGGFIAACHFEPNNRGPHVIGGYDTKEYALGSMDELQALVSTSFKGGRR